MDAPRVVERVRWWVSALGPLATLAIFVPMLRWAARRDVAHCVGADPADGLVRVHHGQFLEMAVVATLPTVAAMVATRGMGRWALAPLVGLVLAVGLVGEWWIGQGDCRQLFTF